MCFWTGYGMWNQLWMVLLFSDILLKEACAKTTVSLNLWEMLWVCSKWTKQRPLETNFRSTWNQNWFFLTLFFINHSGTWQPFLTIGCMKIQFHQKMLKGSWTAFHIDFMSLRGKTSHYYCTLSVISVVYDGNVQKTQRIVMKANRKHAPTSFSPFTCSAKDQAWVFSERCMKYDDVWSPSGHSANHESCKLWF